MAGAQRARRAGAGPERKSASRQLPAGRMPFPAARACASPGRAPAAAEFGWIQQGCRVCGRCRGEAVAIPIALIGKDHERACRRRDAATGSSPAAAIDRRDPAAQLLERPDEKDLMAKRQAEEADRGEDEDHTGQVKERLEKDRDRRPDVAAAADGRAGREPGSEPVDEAGAHDQGEHEADGRAEAIGHGASADQKDVDDGEPQHQEPRRPAETDEQNMGEERADGAARIGGGLIGGIGAPARGIGRVVSRRG